MLSSFLKVAEAVSNIKKQEVPLPISRKMAIITPLRVGDDISLKSSLVSPVHYDRDISKLLFNHTEVVLNEGETPIKENFEKFCATTSNIDKICLIWGMYKTTYEVLGARNFECKQETCKQKFKHEVTLESLIHEDTFTFWEEEQPFYDYIYPIEIEYSDTGYIYTFNSRIPSIKDNNRLMSCLSIDTLQNNLSKTGSLFAKHEQIALLSKSISIRKKDQSSTEDIPKTEDVQEMLMALSNYYPHTVSEQFLEKYHEKFNNYYPKFYTKVKCPYCGHEIDFRIDLEIEFFRRSVFGRREGVEEL
ncbi:MAG: hypothetical protein PHD05_01270 [Sphaerochaetaceae bacterium]|jgi:hypothetical protein|nr:hypothetical protein [Sphaerochaetaceae bacterium]